MDWRCEADRRTPGDRPVSPDPRFGRKRAGRSVSRGANRRSGVISAGAWPKRRRRAPGRLPGRVYEALPAAARTRPGHLHFATPGLGFTPRTAYRKTASIDGRAGSFALAYGNLSVYPLVRPTAREHVAICAARVGRSAATGRWRAVGPVGAIQKLQVVADEFDLRGDPAPGRHQKLIQEMSNGN